MDSTTQILGQVEQLAASLAPAMVRDPALAERVSAEVRMVLEAFSEHRKSRAQDDVCDLNDTPGHAPANRI